MYKTNFVVDEIQLRVANRRDYYEIEFPLLVPAPRDFPGVSKMPRGISPVRLSNDSSLVLNASSLSEGDIIWLTGKITADTPVACIF
jgi:hypothetical protein